MRGGQKEKFSEKISLERMFLLILVVMLDKNAAFFLEKTRTLALFVRSKSASSDFLAKLFLLIFCAHFFSEMNLVVLEGFLPQPSVIVSQGKVQKKEETLKDQDLQLIVSRNLFNSKGLLPGLDEQKVDFFDSDSPAVKTSLNMKVIGVMIFQNSDFSIASLEDLDAHVAYPVRRDDEIPNRLRILSIADNKVTFVNLQDNRKEYLEFHTTKEILSLKTVSADVVDAAGNVSRVIDRKAIEGALGDLNNVLTQAKAVPDFEGGKPSGYRLFQIVPGSIFDKLGLKDGDVIIGLNGQSVTDPTKALELLSELKTASHIEVQIKKERGSVNYVYDVK
jgi:general secretion pathway protein C